MVESAGKSHLVNKLSYNQTNYLNVDKENSGWYVTQYDVYYKTIVLSRQV